MTSVARSHALNQLIALAMLQPELAKLGNAVRIRLSSGQMTSAKVVRTPFYDADNRRQAQSEAA